MRCVIWPNLSYLTGLNFHLSERQLFDISQSALTLSVLPDWKHQAAGCQHPVEDHLYR